MTVPPRRSSAEHNVQRITAECPACSTPLRLTLEVDSSAATSPAGSPKATAEASIGTLVRKVTFVSEDTPLSEVSELFVTTGARLVIVVTPDQKPLGVVTPTHVLRAIKRNPDRSLAKLRALEAATSGGAMLPETTPVVVAIKLLTDQDRDFCVILGNDGRAAGILLATDLLETVLPGPASSRAPHG